MRLRLLAMLVLVVPVLAACGSDEGGSDAASDGKCTYVEDGEAAKEAELPPSEPKAAETLTVATNRGDIELTLTPDAVPCTVNSFVSLAEQGYFDGTKCHRLVPGFVLQCGDPAATGAGGPGYRFDDELTGDETYPAGTLAMANAGPDTNGSQFFIVLAEADLPPSYTVFGTVDEAGLDVARAIEKDGNGADGVSPVRDVVIESVS
jgi:peptidyl-prolyl cis-trans isomerase B (cyclophilin B)